MVVNVFQRREVGLRRGGWRKGGVVAAFVILDNHYVQSVVAG